MTKHSQCCKCVLPLWQGSFAHLLYSQDSFEHIVCLFIFLSVSPSLGAENLTLCLSVLPLKHICDVSSFRQLCYSMAINTVCVFLYQHKFSCLFDVVSFQIFCPLYNWVFCFLIIECWVLLTCSEYYSLVRNVVCKYFLPICKLLSFNSPKIVFQKERLFNFNGVLFINFFFSWVIFWLTYPGHKDFLLCFYLEAFSITFYI